MNVLKNLFGKVSSLVSSPEPVAPPVDVAPVEEITYPYIWDGYDNGYDRVHPELVLSRRDAAHAYRMSAGESMSVTFADGVVAEVQHELMSSWDDSYVYHLVTFEMYKEFIKTVDNF